MIDTPGEVLAVIKKHAEKHPDDPDKAAEGSLRELKRCPEAAAHVEFLAFKGALEAVYDARDQMTKSEMRKVWNPPPSRPPVRLGASPELNQLAAQERRHMEESLVNMRKIHISGRAIASVYGRELDDLAASQEGLADGHRTKAQLCRLLKQRVPENRTVGEALDDRQFDRIARQLSREHLEDAA